MNSFGKINIIIDATYQIFCVTILICLTSCTTKCFNNNYDTAILNDFYAINAHISFDCIRNRSNDIIKDIKTIGVTDLRLDVYWYWDDETYNLDKNDKAVYDAVQNGLTLVLNLCQVPDKFDEGSIKKWENRIRFYAERYNGKTIIPANSEHPEFKAKVVYWEIMNEPEIAAQKNNISVPLLFDMIKRASRVLRESRGNSEIHIVLSALCYINEFTISLLQHKDKEGLSLDSLIDICNVHIYLDKDFEFVSRIQD